MSSENLEIDNNNKVVSGAITDDSNKFIKMLRIDDATKALKVSVIAGTIGTVTSVSVVSANGFAGTVATATTTPAITLTTTVNAPVLAGNGTAISAATTTGSGSTVVLATSPVLITPTLGVASATTINKVTITASAIGSTLTIQDGFTLTANGNATVSGTNTGDQTITLTGDVTGSGTGSFATTLATVNSNVGTFGSATQSTQITANGKGLITAIANVTVTPAVGSITGLGSGIGTWLATPSSANLYSAMTDKTGSGGVLVFATSPTLTTAVLGSSTATTQSPADNSTKVATTAYVDAAVLGQNFKEACKYASTSALAASVYNNGASGVGATLTEVGLGALVLDGSTPSVGDRVLIKNQVSTFQNGIYTVTIVGSVGAVFVLTRATDANQTTEFKTGDSVFITAGSTLANTTWAYTGIDNPTIGTDAITYVQTAGQGTVTAGNGITVTGLSVAIDTTVTVDKTTAQALTNKDLTGAGNTFPIFNQNTTGSAAKLTTARTIGGVSFDGTANITVATATGGFTVSGGNLAIGANALTSSAASPLLLTNGQLATIALTSQTVGATTLTIPNFANVNDTFAFVTLAQTFTNKTFTTPVINGTITGTGQAIAATASTIAMRDANANLTANNHIESYTTTVTANQTTTLVVGSTYQQYFTGSTTNQIVQLPVASTLVLGQQFNIVNNSSVSITVNSSGGNLVQTIATVSSAIVTCIKVSGTDQTSWSVAYITAGGTGTVTNVAWTTSQGVSASIANASTTPNITVTLGALTGVTSFNGLVVTANTGAITTGTWNGTIITGTYGGTGVNNGSFTITLAGNLVTTGAFNTTFAQGATTTVTLPTTSSTMARTDAAQTFTGIQTFSTPIALASGGTNSNLTASNGGIVYSDVDDLEILAGTATANQILYSGANTAPSWSVPTFPVTASATSRKIITSDGTNWVASTETYATPGTSGNVLTSDGTNWLSSPPAASGITFAPQDISIAQFGAHAPIFYATTSNAIGTVMFFAWIDNGNTGSINIARVLKDTSTGNYYITHETTLAVSSNGLQSMAVIGSNLYVQCVISGTGALERYSTTDLSGAQQMTISGTNDLAIGSGMWGEGTNLHVYSASGSYRTYSISGTTATAGSTVAFTSAGVAKTAISDGTNVWISNTTADGTYNIRKYPIAGGAVTSTTSPIIHWTQYVGSNPGTMFPQVFLSSSSILAINWLYIAQQDATISGMFTHMFGITLP